MDVKNVKWIFILALILGTAHSGTGIYFQNNSFFIGAQNCILPIGTRAINSQTQKHANTTHTYTQTIPVSVCLSVFLQIHY